MATGQVFTKPWFLTFDNGEVFIWKSGCRMKLAKNQRAGNVINVPVVKDLQTLCTSAAPEWAVLQFSVDLCKHCVPQLHLKGLFSSSLWTLCTLSLQPLQALCTSANETPC